ncbi:hypothetical protein C8J57DRAFT_724396 [Mycena rebaudengoi]|nr:hypothetical protein C8J57DRAFT_724396 [Mycena rebaudengoi]
MVFRNTILFVLCTALLVVSQSSSGTPTSADAGFTLPSSTAGLDPCMETCFERAAAANSCAIDDVNCTCASAQLQADLSECLDAQCSAFAVPQAQGLLTQLCNKVGVAATGTPTPGHLAVSKPSATDTNTNNGLPQNPLKNQQSSSIKIAAHACLATLCIASSVVGSLAWTWI